MKTAFYLGSAVALCVLGAPSLSHAAPPPSQDNSPLANRRCYPEPQQLPAATISAFLANPSQLLSQYPNGGAQMVSQVRNLVATDPATLNAVINLIANATKDQQSAIGGALGQVALCARQALATQIQQALAATNNQNAITAYADVTGDQPIGATGGGGGGGGVGGPTGTTGFAFGGSNGGTENFSNNGAGNSFGNLLTGGFVSTPGILSSVTTP